jgi:glucose-1-phosphate adenylyltransferase
VKSSKMTVACIDVPISEAKYFGVMQVESNGRIVGFEEKPAEAKPIPGQPGRALASMGIYACDAQFLYEQLVRDAEDQSSSHDFGKDFIPRLIREGIPVYVHRFAESCVNMTGGVPYWRDVGTIDAYWEANIALTKVIPDLNLYDKDWPIWTYQEQLPSAKFVFDEPSRRGMAIDSMVSGGCIISGSLVKRSLLFSNVHVHDFCTIEDSVILPDVDVGSGVVLKHTVVDKYCKLPQGFAAGIDPVEDRKRFHVTEKGITLIVPEMLGQRIHHQ